jgi:chromosome segregation ATPase
MEDRTTQSSLAEKMNQLYKEREEQYQRREKLFDERGAQLQSLSDSLEKKKNALDERANVLNGREAELNQVQDALTAKLNELEKKEADLKAWEQKTRADLEAEKQAQTNDLLEKKVAQENELMKRQQELQIEKLQAQNLSSELKAERESINAMRENFKLFPDQMLTSEKEEEYKKQIEELSRLLEQNAAMQTSWDHERENLTSRITQLTSDLELRDAALQSMQEKLDDNAADHSEDEDLKKRNGELQVKVIELSGKNKALQKQVDELEEELENLETEKPTVHAELSAEELENYLHELPEFENVSTSHNTDGVIVNAEYSDKKYHFRFDQIPCFDISVPRQETRELKKNIYAMNTKYPEYKFSYDDYAKAIVVTGWYRPDTSAESLVENAVEAARKFIE